MISKYLTDINIKEENIPWFWNPNDSRQEQWKEQRKKYGFDERDTWSLSYTLILLIYPRLKMYDEINIVDTSFHKIKHKDKEYTCQECIDRVLKGMEIYLSKDELDLKDEEIKELGECMIILGKIWWLLWW